jgi:cytochrome c
MNSELVCRALRATQWLIIFSSMLLIAQARAADAARGASLYESRCGGCHSVNTDRIGPRHAGVIGRKAGSVPGFDYSPAVRTSEIVWSPETLDRWLANPEALIPGQKMGYRLSDAQERADVIAFLQTQNASAR